MASLSESSFSILDGGKVVQGLISGAGIARFKWKSCHSLVNLNAVLMCVTNSVTLLTHGITV